MAGARRFRAAQFAELFSLPARIVTIDDAQALEWQLVENSQRVDVHPYEEAQGFQRLLDMPGYDVSTMVEKSGKSAAHVYARLSLLQLIPAVAEAFLAESITASHANLLARLPQDAQANAFEQCWREDWQDKEPHLLPAKHLSAWIQANLYLSLADAPFSKEDPTLNPPAGACVTCPRRSGFNTSLFADVQGDQCLDAPCFQTKVNAHIDREVAAHPEYVQIETGYRAPKEQRPDAVQRGHFRQIENPNPDAEPVAACAAAKTALVVFGKRVGTTLTICTDDHCPIHDPRAAARKAQQEQQNPTPVMAPVAEEETSEEAVQRAAEVEQRRKEHQAAEQRRTEERRQQQQREEAEDEARQAEREEQRKARAAIFERMLEHAPETPTAPQLRVLLRAIVHLDPYTFADDLAEDIADSNDRRGAEELLLATIDDTDDEKLTRFALRLALSGHVGIPRENGLDFLTEAAAVFSQEKPKRTPASKPTLVKGSRTKPAAKKKAAA